MSLLYHLRHIIIFALALNLTQCTDTTKYDCVDAHFPQTRIFNSILEYQGNKMEFSRKENFVAFNVTTIRQLHKNDFLTLGSNHIRKLILNDKRIETMDPGAFMELFCVYSLLLQDNLIVNIEKGTFDGLESLSELYLSGNNIAEIPGSTFVNLRNLLKLDLSHNRISILTYQSFSHLKNLFQLYLNNNQLNVLAMGLFGDTKFLSKLYLGNNKIKLDHDGSDFNQLENLLTLDISNNEIENIPSREYYKLQLLTVLKLSGNKLYQLDVHALPASLNRIYLDNNAWQCDTLQEIANQLEAANIGIVINRHTITKNVTVTDLGCYKGAATYTSFVSTTTGIPWWVTSSTSSTTTNKPDVPTTTTEIPNKNKTANTSVDGGYLSDADKNGIISAINNLKVVIIILILVIVIFNASDIMCRMNVCARFFDRRSTLGRYRFSGHSNSSLPLIER